MALVKRKKIAWDYLKSMKSLRIHTAVSTDLEANLFFFDDQHMYHLDMVSAELQPSSLKVIEFRTYPEVYVQGVQLIGNRFLYLLHNPETV
jgi:hypothetical protein